MLCQIILKYKCMFSLDVLLVSTQKLISANQNIFLWGSVAFCPKSMQQNKIQI